MYYSGINCLVSNIDFVAYDLDIEEWNNDDNCYYVESWLFDEPYYIRSSGNGSMHTTYYFDDYETCSNMSHFPSVTSANFSVSHVSNLNMWAKGYCYQIVGTSYSFSPIYPYVYDCWGTLNYDEPCSNHGLCLNSRMCECPDYIGYECKMSQTVFRLIIGLSSTGTFLIVCFFVLVVLVCCVHLIILLGIVCCVATSFAIIPLLFPLFLMRKVYTKIVPFEIIRESPGSSKTDDEDSRLDQFDKAELEGRRRSEAEYLMGGVSDGKGDSYVCSLPKAHQEMFSIKYEDIKVIRKIAGEIEFDSRRPSIFHIKWKGKDCAFANDYFRNEGVRKEFEREIEIMSSIHHPYCLTMYGCCLHRPRIGIVMEMCEKGDLRVFLRNHPSYSLKERIRILANISDGMEYLHERKIIHRDLKCENILIDSNYYPRIIDFGYSRIVKRMSAYKTSRIGTSYYSMKKCFGFYLTIFKMKTVAPELVLGMNIYDEKCDVFSFSMVIFELLSMNLDPFSSFNFHINDISKQIASDEDLRPNLDDLSEEVRDEYFEIVELMVLSWKHDPEIRPSFSEIKKVFCKCMDDDDDEFQGKNDSLKQ